MLSPEAIAAHAAWKASIEECYAIRQRLPLESLPDTDEGRRGWIERNDAIKAQWYAADHARSDAFQVMSDALPEAGKLVFISPRDWLARKWRMERAAVKIWTAPEWAPKGRWYAALALYDIDLDTGERFLRQVEMYDNCVDEAARWNAQLKEAA